MKTTLQQLATILALSAGLLITSACTTTTGRVATKVSASSKPSAAAQTQNPRKVPELWKTFRPGHDVTVIQKDGAIRSFTVTRVKGDTVYGKDASTTPVAIPLADLNYAEVSGTPGGKVANSLLGAFAKTGKTTGQAILTGVAILHYPNSGYYCD